MFIKANLLVLKLGIVLFSDFDQLDVTGPLEIFHEFPNTEVYFISKSLDPVKSEQGITITPNLTFDSAPQMDIIFVPGGGGILNAMENNASLISFLQAQSPHARYISSVCTGSLILGYAGLLKGYKATSHWLAKKYLPVLGAISVNKRVVVDRNRVTGAGVSAGLDLALEIGGILFGKAFVETQQLLCEYHPKFHRYRDGAYEKASPKVYTEEVKKIMDSTIRSRDLFFEKILLHKNSKSPVDD